MTLIDTAQELTELRCLVPDIGGQPFETVFTDHFRKADDLSDDSPKTRRLRAVRSMIAERQLPPWAFLPPQKGQAERARRSSDRARAALAQYAQHRESVNLRVRRLGSIACMSGMGHSIIRLRQQQSVHESMVALINTATADMDAPYVGEYARRTVSAVHAICSTDPEMWRPLYSTEDALESDRLHAAWLDAAEIAYRDRWQQGWPGDGLAPGCPADDWDIEERHTVLAMANAG